MNKFNQKLLTFLNTLTLEDLESSALEAEFNWLDEKPSQDSKVEMVVFFRTKEGVKKANSIISLDWDIDTESPLYDVWEKVRWIVKRGNK